MENQLAQLDRKREQYRAQLTAALQEEEDPLAAYDQFVKWTIEHYPDNLLAQSGLLELLEEATRQFKDDDGYKGDRRYLKLWLLYASHVGDPTVIYSFLLANKIGTVYAQVYEEFAAALEASGRRSDAGKVYQVGIQRRARPLERLKTRYAEFQARPASSSPPSASTSIWRDAPPSTQSLRRNPLKNYSSPEPGSSNEVSQSKPSSSSTSTSPPSSHGHDRYAHIRAPPAAGKRPEKLRFKLSLLFTEEGVEYSIAEARARSMGLLGKRWGPPPASELSRTARVEFNDDGMKNTRNMTSRNRFAGAEPTVTLATKEALADVFGMYNSPEKSMRFGMVAGSKHAPVRKIEPVTPIALQPQFKASLSSENADTGGKTPSAFRPYVDPGTARKENSTPAPPKFKPFVDDPPNPSTTPAPPRPSENALPPRTPSVLKPLTEEQRLAPKVFTPAAALAEKPLSRKDIFTDEPQQPARITPFVDPKPPAQPFKVFSRPPASTENAALKRSILQPYTDGAREPFKPTRSALGERTPLRAFSPPTPPPAEPPHQEAEAEPEPEEDYYDESTTESSDIDDTPNNNVAIPVEDYNEEDFSIYDDDDGEPHHAPLGGRLGHVNVMTPITERTLEYTSSTRGSATPFTIHKDPVGAAEQLAAELQQDEDEDAADDGMQYIEERTGTLSLSDALAVASKFNPPNPCNPFDNPIQSTLLSLIPADPAFVDLRQQEANHLDDLQKFAKKKSRRASGTSTSSRLMQDDETLQVNLAGHVYDVVEKLGEGGFGAVFEAIDVQAANSKGRKPQDDDDDDYMSEGGDEEETPKVALKVVKPRNLWEFHVLRRIHLTLSPHLRQSVINPEALYAYRDESYLVLELCNQGTLLDIVNRAGHAGITQQGACLDELLVMFFTIELMRLLEGLHQAGFIHGDVKIDNCLLRLEDVPGPATAWTSVYSPSGEGGWSHKGIKMIDFGRTIDTRLFPSGQQFIGDWPTDARDCVELREGKPWTYQSDYFGLAGIIYCMLYGKYIEASSVTLTSSSSSSPSSPGGEERYKLVTPLKRYWQVDLWTRLFDVLLNPTLVRADGHLPVCDEMAELRREMEIWLQANCNRASNSLKGLLKKIGLSLLGGKDGRR